MSESINSFKSVIGCWRSVAGDRTDKSAIQAFADDIGIQFYTAKGMYQRDSIPPGYWSETVAAAARRGFDDVTLAVLASLAAKDRAA